MLCSDGVCSEVPMNLTQIQVREGGRLLAALVPHTTFPQAAVSARPVRTAPIIPQSATSVDCSPVPSPPGSAPNHDSAVRRVGCTHASANRRVGGRKAAGALVRTPVCLDRRYPTGLLAACRSPVQARYAARLL